MPTKSGANIMARPPIQPQQSPIPQITDPDSVPETLCLGPFNLAVIGPLAVFTFTHIRPEADRLVRQGATSHAAVVRARIVIPTDDLTAVRGIIDETLRNISAGAGSASPVTGSVRH
jgi:hypothetical protein